MTWCQVMSNTLSRKNAKNVPCCVKATFYTSSMVFSISSLTGLLKRLKNVNASWGWINKACSMCRGLLQMVSVIAPEVPELIKKQDHTPVQSRQRREEEGRMQSMDWGFSPECQRALKSRCHQKMSKIMNRLFVHSDGYSRSVLN